MKNNGNKSMVEELASITIRLGWFWFFIIAIVIFGLTQPKGSQTTLYKIKKVEDER